MAPVIRVRHALFLKQDGCCRCWLAVLAYAPVAKSSHDILLLEELSLESESLIEVCDLHRALLQKIGALVLHCCRFCLGRYMQTYAGVCSSLQVSAAVERRGAPKLGKKRYVSWRKKRRCEPAMRRCLQVYVALRRCLRRKKASPALRPLPKAGESQGPEASFLGYSRSLRLSGNPVKDIAERAIVALHRLAFGLRHGSEVDDQVATQRFGCEHSLLLGAFFDE